MKASIPKYRRSRKAARPSMTRDDLTFTGRTPNPAHREYPGIINWLPQRVPPQINQWNVEARQGEAMVAELHRLREASEVEAFNAIWCALNCTGWRPGYGAEHGFSQGIAALAILGMRAIAGGAAPFVAEEHSLWS